MIRARPDPLPDLPADVATALAAMPGPVRHRVMDLRQVMHREATVCAAGPLTETLKWGEPAWLTDVTKSGTTLRLAWKPAAPDYLLLCVNCQTDLLDRYRTQFPDEFRYQGNRAVLLPVSGDLPDEPLRRVIGQALTYHRDKRRRAS